MELKDKNILNLFLHLFLNVSIHTNNPCVLQDGLLCKLFMLLFENMILRWIFYKIGTWALLIMGRDLTTYHIISCLCKKNFPKPNSLCFRVELCKLKPSKIRTGSWCINLSFVLYRICVSLCHICVKRYSPKLNLWNFRFEICKNTKKYRQVHVMLMCHVEIYKSNYKIIMKRFWATP